MNMTRWLAALVVFLTIVSASPLRAASEDVKNIVLIAGLKSHGPEGNGIHDYAWSARLLKTALEHSNIREHVNVTVHFNGWPVDFRSLQDADTLMIISDGRDGETAAKLLIWPRTNVCRLSIHS